MKKKELKQKVEFAIGIIEALESALNDARKERDEYKQKILDLEAESADPMDGSRICDQDGNRDDLVKAVEETKGIWKDREDLWDRTSSMDGKVVEVIYSEYYPHPLPKHVTYHVDGDREWVEPVILQKTKMMEVRINKPDDD